MPSPPPLPPEPAQRDVLLRLRDVGRTFQMGEVSVVALQDFTLDVYQGELLVLLGPSGSGKTTILNIVGGLLTLLLGKSPNGIPYSSFETLESVISALIAHYGDKSGISERTLWAKFSAAKRHLATQDR